MGEVIELTKQALWLTLVLSGPPVGAAALVGLLVAFLQAATQLQEQTFAYALKFFTVVVTLFITAALIGGPLYTFADGTFSGFPCMVRHCRARAAPVNAVRTIPRQPSAGAAPDPAAHFRRLPLAAGASHPDTPADLEPQLP